MTTQIHSTLIDPQTGEPLEALGFRENGQPIWPMIGGSDGIGVPTLDADSEEDKGGDEGDSGDSEEEAPKPKVKPKVEPKVEDDSEEDEDLDSPMKLRDARRIRRENQKLREASKLAEAERKELEELREAKLDEKQRLENRAKKGESTVAELTAQLEEARLRSALGLPEPDDDEDDDDYELIPVKGSTYEEKLANARRFAKRFKIGRYAAADEDKPKGTARKTPPPKELRGQRGSDDDPEDDPTKLAARLVGSKFGI